MNILDIRQSEEWAQYLKTLGWTSIRTSKDTNIETRRTPFGSLVKIQRPDPISSTDLKEIEKICRENKALFIKFEPSLNQSLEILENAGYVLSSSPLLPPSTVFIHLEKSEGDLWEQISRSGKYSTRRSQREKTKIEYIQNPSKEKVKECYAVISQTAKRKKFISENLAGFLNKASIFKDNTYILNAHNQSGEIAASFFYLGFKEGVWYMHAGTTPAGRRGFGGYELMWRSFLYFKEKGLKILDLEGKDDSRFPTFTRNWGGLSFFKEKFGGEKIEYPRPYIKYLHPLFLKLHKINPYLPL